MSKIIYNIKPFGTIEELTLSTFDFVVGDIIDLQGYYEAGDGAHHKRKISSEDDGSGVQLINGLWANIVHNGEVNVSWFGVREGEFLDFKKIKCDSLNVDVSVETESFECNFNLFSTSNKILTINSSSEVFLYLPSFKKIDSMNIKFKDKTKNGNKVGVTFFSETDTIESCSITNSTFECLDFFENGKPMIYGVFCRSKSKNVKNIHIQNNVFLNTQYGVHFDHMFWEEPNSNVFFENFLIEGNKLQGANIGINTPTCNCRNITISNNVIKDINFHINIAGCNNFTISNNDLLVSKKIKSFANYSSSEYGIHIEDASYTYTISNNTIKIDKDFSWFGSENAIVILTRTNNGTVVEDVSSRDNIYGYITGNLINGKFAVPENYLKDTSRIFINNNKIIHDGRESAVVNYENLYSSNNFIDSSVAFYGARIKSISDTVLCDSLFFSDSLSSEIIMCDLITRNQGVFENRANIYNSKLTLTDLTIESNKPIEVIRKFGYSKESFKFTLVNNLNHSIDSRYHVEMATDGSCSSIKMIEQNAGSMSLLVSASNLMASINTFGSTLSGRNIVIEPLTFANKIRETPFLLNLDLLDTPYYTLKMQQEGIYEDFISYMDEQHEYERLQREPEEQRQLEFESREDQEKSYEDWLSTQPQLMPFEEPQPSQTLLDFKEKYLG